MKYEMVPVITIRDLEKALETQFDIDADDLRNILFGDEYYNDSFKKYYFSSKWESYDENPIEQCAKAYLKDIFPNHEYVLIDVSW